jgi:predicted Rossmann fold flavoprotein
MNIAIIGGGAAGFFAAFSVREHHPNAVITIYEKSDKLLSKVKISGGGRCNLTHACFKPSQLSKFYPRGEKQLKKAFSQFNTNHTVEWFQSRGVELKAEADNRMFPVTDNSQTIIDCFLREAQQKKITILQKSPITKILAKGGAFELQLMTKSIHMDKVIVATGGSPKIKGFEWLSDLGHQIIAPVPSLFTFNMPNEPIKKLMGLVAENATVRIQGSKLQYTGPLLVTHWGMSGPAILKLSAWGARLLNDCNYQFKTQVNWVSAKNEEEVFKVISDCQLSYHKRKIVNKNPFSIPNRLWLFLLDKVGIGSEVIWADLNKKSRNRLVNTIFNDVYEVSGKTTFKEEFVTSGGVSLADVDIKTMQSRVCENLYFAGEVIDIDGITGGFNFQAAWTTGFIAGKLID